MPITPSTAAVTNQIRVRLFNVGNRGSKLMKFLADPGNGYTEKGVQELLDGIVERMDANFPADDFDIVRVAPFSYNVVWRRSRVAPQCLPVGKP